MSETQTPPDGPAYVVRADEGRARITVVDTVYFQPKDGPAVSLDSRFSRWVDSDEAPYLRPSAKVGEEWTPLDLGWLASETVGMLLIRNDGERDIWLAVSRPNTDPSANPIPFAWISAGESARFDPVCDSEYRVSAPDGPSRYTLLLLPG